MRTIATVVALGLVLGVTFVKFTGGESESPPLQQAILANVATSECIGDCAQKPAATPIPCLTCNQDENTWQRKTMKAPPVLGAESVFAVGDLASHGIKQGGLAAQQADVAAQVIAATAGADVQPRPYRPVLRGMLITGGEVRYLRHEPDGTSDVSDEALWWPPHKVAGRHLAHYLASHTELALPAQPAGVA